MAGTDGVQGSAIGHIRCILDRSGGHLRRTLNHLIDGLLLSVLGGFDTFVLPKNVPS